jgi:hypothetical protein
MTIPVAASAPANTRLKFSAATCCASLAPEPGGNCLRGRDTGPHRQVDRSEIARLRRRRSEGGDERSRQADDDPDCRGAADTFVHRYAGHEHHEIGHDAAADPGEARHHSDAEPGEAAKIAIGRLIEHRPEALRRGEAHRRHQREEREGAGQNVSPQMRCEQLRGDDPECNAGTPFAEEGEIGVARPPMTERGSQRGRQDRCQRGGDRDMRRLVGRGAGAEQPVIHHRHDDDAAADADQSGEQPGPGSGHQPQANEPRNAHRGVSLDLVAVVIPTPGATARRRWPSALEHDPDGHVVTGDVEDGGQSPSRAVRQRNGHEAGQQADGRCEHSFHDAFPQKALSRPSQPTRVLCLRRCPKRCDVLHRFRKFLPLPIRPHSSLDRGDVRYSISAAIGALRNSGGGLK